LNTVEKSSITNEIWVAGLREERNDCDSRVSTNNGDILISWVGVLDFGNESGSTNDIEGSDTEETLGVVDTCRFENFGDNWDGAVYWVGDNQDVGIWGTLGSGFGKIADNGSIGVEKIVTAHSWLSGNTGGDQNNFCTFQG